MARIILTTLCVVAAAGGAVAGAPEPEGKAPTLAGRWQGPHYRMAAAAPDCGEGKCMLTLDMVPCGKGWCGIEVESDNRCGGTALTLGAGEEGVASTVFKGELALARGTEPYVVQAYLLPAAGEASEELEIIGDTGGEFRAFRRSFPFNAHLARAGEAVCKNEKPVS